MNDWSRISLTGTAAASAPDDDWKAKALVFRAQRQALIASNIANADTPNYLARDVNFSEALERAKRDQVASPMVATSPQHIVSDLRAQQSTLQLAQFALSSQPSIDGNTVDMDRERASFAQNSILHQLAISTLADELKEFKMAAEIPRR